MLTMEIWAVFVLLFLFACSFANFVNQLPNCKTATRVAIKRNVTEISYFLILLKRSMVEMRFFMIFRPREFLFFLPSSDDRIPGIVVVVLTAYSLTNALLHLPNSTAAVIDWIVLEMVYPFKLKTYFKTLRSRIHILRETIDELTDDIEEELNGNEETKKQKLAELWMSRKVVLLEESVQLSDEVAQIVNRCCRGWLGSRYRLSKRAKLLILEIENEVDCEDIARGNFARSIVSDIDNIRDTFPAAITNFIQYLDFNTNVETLRSKIHLLQQQLNSTPLSCLQISEEEAQKRAASIEEAKNDAMQLIQEVEHMHKSWYKKQFGSRYRLGKRVVKMILHIDESLKYVIP